MKVYLDTKDGRQDITGIEFVASWQDSYANQYNTHLQEDSIIISLGVTPYIITKGTNLHIGEMAVKHYSRIILMGGVI